MDVRLHTFPSIDVDFRQFAQAALAGLDELRTPAALQHAIRERYPLAVVTPQAELARHGDGPTIWYAFRTGAASAPADEEAETRHRSAAWAILDDGRRFLEVSPALARIMELPPAQIVGHLVDEFSNAADPTIREDLERMWAEFRAGGSLASTIRFNYADGRPRELAFSVIADAGGPGRHRLTVKMLEESES